MRVGNSQLMSSVETLQSVENVNRSSDTCTAYRYTVLVTVCKRLYLSSLIVGTIMAERPEFLRVKPRGLGVT